MSNLSDAATNASANRPGSNDPIAEHRSLWGDVWSQFSTHKGALIGTVVFILILLVVLVGPSIHTICLLYTSPSPRDATLSRMPSSA